MKRIGPYPVSSPWLRLAFLLTLCFAPTIALAGTKTLNFDVDAGGNPIIIPPFTTLDATSYFAGFGITLSGITPGGAVVIRNDGDPANFISPSSPPNTMSFQMACCSAVTWTLNFPTTLSMVSVTRPLLHAGPSGVTHPSWTITAYDSAGNELASDGQGLISSLSDVPAETFTLSGTGITKLVFDSDGFHFASTIAVVLDDLIWATGPPPPPPSPPPGSATYQFTGATYQGEPVYTSVDYNSPSGFITSFIGNATTSCSLSSPSPFFADLAGCANVVFDPGGIRAGGQIVDTIIVYPIFDPPGLCVGCALTFEFPVGAFAANGTYPELNGNGQLTVLGTPAVAISAPTNVRGHQAGSTGNQIDLIWDYGNDSIDGFSIERKLPSGGWISAPQATVSLTSACDSNVSPHKCFYTDIAVPGFSTVSYRVRAYQGSTYSDYSNVVTAYQLAISIRDPHGSVIEAYFTPDHTLTLSAAATALPPDDPTLPFSNTKFDHFNWIQFIQYDPLCSLSDSDMRLHAWQSGSPPTQGLAQFAPYLDPPPGGYFEYEHYEDMCEQADGTRDQCDGPDDELPFYWAENPHPGTPQPWYLDPLHHILNPDGDLIVAGGDPSQVNKETFHDQPLMPCLPGSSPTNSSDYWGFVTSLMGVLTPIGTQPSIYIPLNTFFWNTTNNGVAGSVFRVKTKNVGPPVTGGTGGIFNVATIDVNDLPPAIRQQLLKAGASGVPTGPYVDKNAPMTASFLSGAQGINGWYTSPVQVTLMATDIDGPSDIATTSYIVDNGSSGTYTAPFMVSGDARHQVFFSSVDLAGNQEAQIKGATLINIDTLAPGFHCSPAPDGAWHATNLVFNCGAQDNLSGLDSSSPSTFVLATTVPTATETANASTNSQQLCDLAGNCVTAAVGSNMIDMKPPTTNVTAPASGAIYNANQVVNAAYTCMDLGSGVAACTGTVPNSTKIDTTPNGVSTPKVFTVKATDAVGNPALQSISYAVSCHYVVLGISPPIVARGGKVTVTGTVGSCATQSQTVSVKFALSGPLGPKSCANTSTVMFTTPSFTIPAGMSKNISFPFLIPKNACPGKFVITSTTLTGGVAVDSSSASLTVQ